MNGTTRTFEFSTSRKFVQYLALILTNTLHFNILKLISFDSIAIKIKVVQNIHQEELVL